MPYLFVFNTLIVYLYWNQGKVNFFAAAEKCLLSSYFRVRVCSLAPNSAHY